MAIEIVDLPSSKMVIFHSYVNVYQGVVHGNCVHVSCGFFSNIAGAFPFKDSMRGFNANSKAVLVEKNTSAAGYGYGPLVGLLQ
jgi:hypothetical protein